MRQIEVVAGRPEAGLAALGGAIWTTTVVLTALRPVGIPGAHRSALDLHPLILVALVLIAGAVTLLAHRFSGGGLAAAAVALAWIAAALFSVNVAFVFATGDDVPVWPTHYSSFFSSALATTLLGAAALHRRVLPWPLALALIAAAPPFVFANMQDNSVLLWLPFGLAWLGAAWWTFRRGSDVERA